VSLAAVTSRVEELRALIATPVGAPSGGTSSAAFATALASASTMGPGSAPAATAAAVSPLQGDGAYDGLINDAAQRNGVDPGLLKGLIRQESGFDPNAGSPAGAQGLTQLMPGTAAALGVSNVNDPAQSIEGGAKYLAQQLKAFGGDESLALAAYNAGPGAVQRYNGVPPYSETQNYVQKVLGYANAYRGSSS
jgi:soluble lytic murein transglycosylase-like protein